MTSPAGGYATVDGRDFMGSCRYNTCQINDFRVDTRVLTRPPALLTGNYDQSKSMLGRIRGHRGVPD
jgi:hypothetical protein